MLQFKLAKDVIDPYIEMKALMDLIIHAGGVVNAVYIEKTKDIAGAAKDGEKISVDRVYFEDSMRGIKRFAAALYKQMVHQYGDDVDVQRVLSERGVD